MLKEKYAHILYRTNMKMFAFLDWLFCPHAIFQRIIQKWRAIKPSKMQKRQFKFMRVDPESIPKMG
jgi:hypothetical protein